MTLCRSRQARPPSLSGRRPRLFPLSRLREPRESNRNSPRFYRAPRVLDRQGHRRLFGCVRSLDELANAGGDARLEFLLQCVELVAIGVAGLVGDHEQSKNPLLIALQFLVAQHSGNDRERRTDDAQRNADRVEVFLRLVDKALVAAGQIGGDARVDRQRGIFSSGSGASI